MYDADKMPSLVDIGYAGEKRFRRIEIDMSKWEGRVPGGVPAVVFLKPGATQAYRPTVTYADHVMVWEVSATDADTFGRGKMQVEMKSAAAAAKSAVSDVAVHEAIMR